MRVIATCTLLLPSAAGRSAAESALLKPDWNDAVLKHAREQPPSARPQLEKKAGQPAISLPRWGFAERIDSPTEAEVSRGLSPTLKSAQPALPECASKVPKIDQSRDGSGTWYTDVYDFGCLVINISGDRAFDTSLAMPKSLGPPGAPADACSGASPAPPTAPDEGDTAGRFELEFSLHGLPYTIVGHCEDGAEAFCRDHKAQCALKNKLILLEGEPQ